MCVKASWLCTEHHIEHVAVNTLLQYGWCEGAIVLRQPLTSPLAGRPLSFSLYINAHPICWGLAYFLPGDQMRVTRKPPNLPSLKRKWLPAVLGPKTSNQAPCPCPEPWVFVPNPLCCFLLSRLLVFLSLPLSLVGLKEGIDGGRGGGRRSWLVNCEETSGPPVA